MGSTGTISLAGFAFTVRERILNSAAQDRDYASDVVLLKHANAGNSCRSGFNTRSRILYGDAAECENRDTVLARVAKRIYSDSGRLMLLKYRSEYNEIGATVFGSIYIFCTMTGNCNQQLEINSSRICH